MLIIDQNKIYVHILKRFWVHYIWRGLLLVLIPLVNAILYVKYLWLKNSFIFMYDWIFIVKRGMIVTINLRNYKHKIIIRKWTSDLDVFKQIFLNQEYKYCYPKKFSPKLIVDWGANVWYSSIYFANRFPNAVVLAIEPEESNFKMLLKNTKSYSNIRAIKKWIWYRNALLKVVNETWWRHWSFRIVETENIEEWLAAITINDLIGMTDYNRVDILKLDIEWAEEEVFENNADNWLKNTDMIFIELHERFKKWSTKKILKIANTYFSKKKISWENLILTK